VIYPEEAVHTEFLKDKAKITGKTFKRLNLNRRSKILSFGNKNYEDGREGGWRTERSLLRSLKNTACARQQLIHIMCFESGKQH